MDLTQRVLNRLRGRLDIIVSHPQVPAKLIVTGVTDCALDYGWEGMPPEMKVNRVVYCCRRADARGKQFFVFADDVTVVDAPADMVVDEILDMLCEMGADGAVDRLQNPDEVWHGDEEE